MSKPVMISVSGIRGIVGEGLSPELIVQFSAAAGTFFGQGNVMVGRDSRVTGIMVQHAVFSALMSVGCSPVDLGICATPTVELAVQHSNAVGGIIITASHNPQDWNALKILGPDGIFLDEEQGNQIKTIIENKSYHYAKWDRIGTVSVKTDATKEHIEKLLKIPYIDIDAIRNKHFTVAYDCVNGAGGVIVPLLLERLECNAIPLNIETHGRFAHDPEPVPANLTELCESVKQNKADVGFAIDPDADRCAIVDENGNAAGEEYTVTIAVQLILSKKKGPVVVNVSTTRAVEDVVKKEGVKIFHTKVGEIHVAKQMLKTGGIIGGEGNGGVILPEFHPGRDAPLGILLTLQAMTELNKPVSEIVGSLPQYKIIKKKININKSNPDILIEKMASKYASEKINRMDGLKIDLPEGWVHIRKSNTEPIIRVVAEAENEKSANLLCARFTDEIHKLIMNENPAV